MFWTAPDNEIESGVCLAPKIMLNLIDGVKGIRPYPIVIGRVFRIIGQFFRGWGIFPIIGFGDQMHTWDGKRDLPSQPYSDVWYKHIYRPNKNGVSWHQPTNNHRRDRLHSQVALS